MRKPSIKIAYLLTAASLLALAPLPKLGAEDLNRIVLRVNDRITTLRDFEKRRADTLEELLRRENDPAERATITREIGEIVFSEMFQDLLLESRADQLAVEANQAQIDAEIARIKKSNNFESDEQFRQALAQSGMTEEVLRRNLAASLRIRAVMSQEVGSRIALKEEDLRRYYRKNQEELRLPEQRQLVEVVVLDQGGLPTAEERAALAARIHAEVAAGKALEEVIKPHAESGATSQLVDLGWVSPGDLDPKLEAAAWKLAPGALGEPVEGRGGLHLILVKERRESRIPPFSEVAQQIEAREQNRLYREEMKKYMTELEQKSLIVAKPPQDAAGFRKRLGSAADQKPLGEELAPAESAATPPPLVTDPTAPPVAAIPQAPKSPDSPPQSPQ